MDNRGILQQGCQTPQNLHLGSLFSIAQLLHREWHFHDCSVVREKRNASYHQKSSLGYFVYLNLHPQKNGCKVSFFSKLARQSQSFEKYKSKSKD